jgi:hypothetical protein
MSSVSTRTAVSEPKTFASIASSGPGRLQIDRPAGAPAEATSRFNRHLCIRQRISDCLMLDDGTNAASPFAASEGEGELERRTHQSHRENSDLRGRAGEASCGEGQTAADAPKDVIAWYANPFESELRQKVRTMPQRFDRAFEE